MDSEGKGTGIISKGDDGGIFTGYDKLREMKKIIAEHATSDTFIMVYIGDANTDLPCLLHAGIGIIMGNASSLIETCKRVGINVESGQSLRKIVEQSQEKGVTSLYHFNDWYDIISSGLLE
jgi:3-deoxy-D-manno-octulosonate 8-phosphate phosphatase KdsC-like HAD superfamily phosphatase